MVPCDHDYSNTANEDDEELTMGGGGSAAGDETLYIQLKSLLRSIAQKENLAPYVIFDDRSIKDMTIQYPCTIEELSRCTGVGVAKAQRNGQPFVDLIKRYVEENEIERPQDIVVRSTVNKSGLKVYIIKSIDRQMPLEDIANGKGISMSDLITEMEHILYSGTKLNIDYYIDANIEQEHQDVLLDYWHSAENDSLDDAIEEFKDDPDYSVEEIRLMRIKFLTSEGF
jgi:ATP-dependent DNA helicase RecQ